MTLTIFIALKTIEVQSGDLRHNAGMSVFCVSLATSVSLLGGWTCTDATPKGWVGAINYSVLGSDTWGGIGSPNKGTRIGFVQRGSEVYVLNQTGFARAVPAGLDQQKLLVYGVGILENGQEHPLIWSSNGGSFVDVLPAGFTSGAVANGNYPYSVGAVWKGTNSFASRAVVWRGDNSNIVADITPVSAVGAVAQSIDGDDVLGGENLNDQGTEQHALLWHGFNQKPIDLNPPGAASSYGLQIQDGEEVGSYILARDTSAHPCLWHGSASSVVDLLPPSYVKGHVNSTSGGWEVGEVEDSSEDIHPTVWQGSASSFQDLTPYIPSGYRVVGESYGMRTLRGLVVYTNAISIVDRISRVLKFVRNLGG